MASALQNLSKYDEINIQDASSLRIGIVVSEWNSDITNALLEGALETLMKHQVKTDNVVISKVPGTFEIPVAAQWLCHKSVDAIICLGCVIKGDTDHDIYINQSVANALQQLSIQHQKAFIFGVLTTNNHEQALDRAGGKHGNKGVEAAITAIRMSFLKKLF